MFFNRLVRNIVIFLIMFVITVNIYYWSIAIQFGTQDQVTYTGFYTFFKNFEKMPRFELFVSTLQDIKTVFTDMSGFEVALSIITLGTYVVAKFTVYLINLSLILFTDILRYFVWILGFIGVPIQ